MDLAAALAHVRAAVVAGKLRLSEHVVDDKLEILDLYANDVFAIVADATIGKLVEATERRADGSEKWKLCGYPASRREMMTAVVDLKTDGRAIVVTIHPYTAEDSE